MPEKRIQSPSSINTFKQCPRRYFYKYISKLPTKPSIHLVRGKIVHSVLEDFFDIDTVNINMKNFEQELRKSLQDIFLGHWQPQRQAIKDLNITGDKEKFYFSETMLMLLNWLEQFIKRIKSFDGLGFSEIFKKLTPLREKRYFSQDLYVQGFIDAIEELDNKVSIIDYKTNANLSLTDEQRLQLGIYSLLYKEKHGKLPNKAGIHFLRYKPKFIAVDDSLLDMAKFEIEFVHENTTSDDIEDYQLKTGPLCKWCDFYKICFEQKSIKDYQTEIQTEQGEQKLKQ